MNLHHIISQMTWSYSRIRCFEDCPYKFFLTYIKCCPEERRFFASFGSFMHAILERYLLGELHKDELTGFYLQNFRNEVQGRAPTEKVFSNYFNSGYRYLSDCNFPTDNVIAVELPVDFDVNGNNFTGIIDYVLRTGDGKLILGDHKSRALKPRSNRKKPTQSDKELDKYFEQLYLYCKPIKDIYGEFPESMEFNCFRTGNIISEPFDIKKYEAVLEKFGTRPGQIAINEKWNPNLEFFKCKHLCGKNGSCEYYQLNEG